MKRAALLPVAVVILAVSLGSTRAATGAASLSVPKCPSHAPKFTSLNLTSSHFVRPGAGAIRLCRFYKVNWADSYGLWRQRLINRPVMISGLTRAFNKLKEPPRGIFCVKDDGSEMLLIFSYASAKPVRVVVKLSGCRFATNGRSTRSTTARLHDRLLALSRP